MESALNRANRFNMALNTVLFHPKEESFKSLIESGQEYFREFKLIYSTDNTTTDMEYVSLDSIEQECTVLKKYYSGSGLLFYSDQIFDETIRNGQVRIPLDYSLCFDSNIAEAFRVWERGGQQSQEEKFYNLTGFVKENDFNFDFSFFIIENYEYLMDVKNNRPFHTIRALKSFDYAEQVKDGGRFLLSTRLSQEDAGREAISAMSEFYRNDYVKELLLRRKVMHLILLKAIALYLDNKKDLHGNLSQIVSYCLRVIGRFPKTEVYFVWKFLKYGKKYNFFSGITNVHKKFFKAVRGMSWDLFSLRYQETLSSKSNVGQFFVPFFASFDNKFIELTQACPIRATLIDYKGNLMHTLYDDEYEFTKDLNDCLSSAVFDDLTDRQAAAKRMSQIIITDEIIDREIKNIEREFE